MRTATVFDLCELSELLLAGHSRRVAAEMAIADEMATALDECVLALTCLLLVQTPT